MPDPNQPPWRIHHIAVPSGDVRASAAFFAHVLDMTEREFPTVPDDAPDKGVFSLGPDDLACYDNGDQQLHVVLKDGDFARKNDMWLNVVLNGHVAIAVPDLGAVKERLTARGTPFIDRGEWAFNGRRQIYTYDPGQNVIEISESVDGAC